MPRKKSILPEEIADDFSVDPKAPVRFVHRIWGEYDLRKINRNAAEFLAGKGLYLKKKSAHGNVGDDQGD